MQTLPKNLYALLNNGERMTGKVYGQLFFDRTSARQAKVKANSSSKIKGKVTIAQFPVQQNWALTR